jgi:ABC-type Mn2+/Zn2+ transport system permease subunit
VSAALEAFRQLLTMDLYRLPLVAALMVAVVSSVMGVYIVLKRIVFVGAALAQTASLGVATGVLIPVVLHRHGPSPLVFAVAFTLIGVILISQLGQRWPISAESLIGVIYAATGALAIVGLSKSPEGEAHIKEIIEGSIVNVQETSQIIVLAVIFGAILVVHLLFYKQFLLVSYDPETAGTLGYHRRLWELLFYLTLGVMISAAMEVAGVLLVFSYLVLPAVTGVLATRSLRGAFAVAIVAALAATVAGLTFSVGADWPPGPAIATCSAAVLAVAGIGIGVARRARGSTS